MALTYQPFENIPEINALGKELHTNVSDVERVLSACAGAYMIVKAIRQNQILKWSLLAGGGALIRRAWSGHCPLYEEMEINQRKKGSNGRPSLTPGPQVPHSQSDSI